MPYKNRGWFHRWCWRCGMITLARRPFHKLAIGAAAATLPTYTISAIVPILHTRTGTALLARGRYPKTQIWGNYGDVPGPVLRPRQGRKMTLIFRNDFPKRLLYTGTVFRSIMRWMGSPGVRRPAMMRWMRSLRAWLPAKLPVFNPVSATVLPAPARSTTPGYGPFWWSWRWLGRR